MAFDAFFPKITLPSNKTDVRKGGGLGIRVAGKFMVADAFQGGEATNGLIAWLKDNNAEQIDLAVATHAHGDHTGGFYDIVNAGIPIKEFRCYHIDSIRGGNDESRKDSDNLLKLIRWLQIRGTRVLFVDHGDVIKFEDISWHIYRNQPARAAADDTYAWDYVNNGSLVLYSSELQGIIFGDGPENPKDAIAYFQKKFGKIEILVWFLISHHGNYFSLSNAVAAKDAGAKFAYESCVEADGPGTTSWTEFGARRVVQQKITVWMQNQNIYIHAAAGKITFKQGSKTLTFNVPYQGEEKEGWVKNTVGWWYRYKDGTWPADCFADLPWSQGVSRFFFDDRGYMATGWRRIDGIWYFFDKTNGDMKTGWIYDNGFWYYLDPETGKMQTGWIEYKGKCCYLEPDPNKNQGHCYVSCTAVIDGITYRFDKNGYVEETSTTISSVKPGAKVIDISEFQPETIDWPKIKAAGYAVIIRIGLRGSVPGTERYRKIAYDYHYKKYIDDVINAGIPYSVYYFPTPLSDAEADAEADWIITNVDGMKLSMPLWLDSERVPGGVANDISTEQRTRFLKRITDKLVAAGIPCGIYASTSWLQNQINMGQFPQQVQDNTWCAQYAGSCTYKGVYAMWQYSSKARVDGINGNVDISEVKQEFNMSCRKTSPKTDTMAKDNVRIFPTTDPVKISNSGSDEHGNYKGGAAGDNTGKEWYIRDWYNRPWNCVLRHPDPEVRACLADLAMKAANNNRIGYDQYQRQTYWTELQKANYDPSKITVACEADCSAGVIANIKAAGYLLGRPELQNITCTYTGNMRAGLRAAGFACLTDSKYLTSSAFLVAGDVLLNDKHHTATAVTNGILSDGSIPAAATMPLLKKGSQGEAVKILQQTLNGKGYKLTEDGDFGNKTEAAVKAFQKANGLEVDGEVGPMTWGVLLK